MRRFSKTPQRTKWLDQWPEWDIVLELDQRDDDPPPAFAISYMRVEVDWDDGSAPVTYTRSSSTQIQTYAGTYPVGKHIVKLRVTQRYNNSGIIYFGNGTASSTIGDPLMPQVLRIKKFNVSGVVNSRPKIQSLNYGFNRCLRLEGVDCPLFMDNVTDATATFRFCVNLKGKVEIPNLASATSLGSFFYNCVNLEEVYIGDASNITNFTYIFYNCPKLRKIKLGSFSKNVSFQNAFWGCKSLSDLTWKGHINFTSLAYCFYGCASLEQIPEIGDQPVCTTINYAFSQCPKLQRAILGDFPACITMTHIFEYDISLEEACFSGLSGVTDASNVFNLCRSLSNMSLDGLGPSMTTFAIGFYGCTSLTGSFTLPDIPECTSLAASFAQSGLSSIIIGNAPKVTTISTMCQHMKNLRHFKAGQMPLVATANTAFQNCEELEELELHIPDGTLNYMQDFCNNCASLKRVIGEVRLRPQGPSTATYWNNLFYFCRSLEEVPDIIPSGGWDASFSTGSVQHTGWFGNCVSLSGTAPSAMWDSWPGRNSTQENTFLNCFGLDNFNDIPVYWRGGNIII